MARKLFEFRATRARSGGLAVGIEYVVWDNEAATVLADISTSSGGSSIAGSTVTTADIAGLGPSACRFWGPPDDQDTLWVTCPSDPTLGVQRVEASTDARLDALEAAGGGAHPNLAAHVTLGLATDARVDILEAEAVYVKDYVAAPDGTTDNTAGLASAFAAAAGKLLVFEHDKVYVQNSTLSPAQDTVVQGNGATLKAGSSRTGTLSTHGRQLSVSSVSGVKVFGLVFPAPASAWGSLDASESATIYILNSPGNTVRDCTFYLTTLSGVFVKGAASLDNKILFNYLEQGGIVYSYNDASRTLCAGNTVINGSLGAVGNGAAWNDDCIVENNHIIGSTYMGIEDFGTTRGTIIRNNVIRDVANMGISAVGRNTLVEGNTVIDPANYGIEAPAQGNRIIGNNVRYTGTPGTDNVGIIINSGAEPPFSGVVVQGNYVENAHQGIQCIDTLVDATIQGNQIVNPLAVGINTQVTSGHLTVQGNLVRYTNPSANYAGGSFRFGVVLGAASPLTASGNTVVWEAAAGGGTLQDVGIGVLGDYHVVIGNVFHGGSITSGAAVAPAGVKAVSGTPTGVRVVANSFNGGATFDSALFVGMVTSRNTGPTGPADTPTVRSASTQRSSGDVTISSTSWVDFDNTLDIVLTAASGDKILVGVNGTWGTEGPVGFLDCATAVSGSPVTYFSSRTGTQATSGMCGWLGTPGDYESVGASGWLTLAGGDVSAGTVTLRLRAKASGASKVMQASASNIFQFTAVNLGPG